MPPTQHFPFDPAYAYKLYGEHAILTGNATSQAMLAFFHSTGYKNVVPVDQAKAQLYYTFAAHGGDKGARMALGYRYWTGIGVAEACEQAVEWYQAAAEHGACQSSVRMQLLIPSRQQWPSFCPVPQGDAPYRWPLLVSLISTVGCMVREPALLLLAQTASVPRSRPPVPARREKHGKTFSSTTSYVSSFSHRPSNLGYVSVQR